MSDLQGMFYGDKVAHLPGFTCHKSLHLGNTNIALSPPEMHPAITAPTPEADRGTDPMS